jgi:hypothetical protein
VLFLLDANVLIDANRDYYPLERVPEFWDWLEYQGETGVVKVPLEVYEELKEGKDVLATWLKQGSVREALLLEEDVEVDLVARTVDQRHAPDLTDDEILKIGRDPFLVAYALKDVGNRTIVTTEVSKPTPRARQPAPSGRLPRFLRPVV